MSNLPSISAVSRFCEVALALVEAPAVLILNKSLSLVSVLRDMRSERLGMGQLKGSYEVCAIALSFFLLKIIAVVVIVINYQF
jgi:hypothetical protein